MIGIVQQVFQLLDAPFQETLVFLGLVVVGILRQIAHLDGRAQALGQLGALGAFQLGQLGFQFFRPFSGQVSIWSLIDFT